MYRNKGTITVFLSLISMLFLSLFCTMAESVRVQAARFQAAAAFDMGLFSIFGEYDRVLLEEYDLWFLDGSSEEQKIREVLETKLEKYIQPNINPRYNLAAGRSWDVFPTELDRCTVDKYALATDHGGQVFYSQAVENQKELFVGEAASALKKNIKQMEEGHQKGEEYQNEENFPAHIQLGIDWALTVQKADGTIQNYSKEMMKLYFKDHGEDNFDLLFDSEEEAQHYVDEYKAAVVGEGETILAERISFAPQPQSSMVIIDQHTGYVKALVGGRGEKTASLTLNRATDTYRQPGSTFKPLAVYGPAINDLGLTLADTYVDQAITYENTNRPVKNAYSGYRGTMTIRDALKYSCNTIAVQCFRDVTPRLGYTYLKDLGFEKVTDHEVINGQVFDDAREPTALGGITNGVSTLELTAAYAAIANGGTYTKPVFYTKILDQNGDVVLENKPKTTEVFRESTAYLLTSALESVVNDEGGTGNGLKLDNIPVAGKTGTTSATRDVWFAGFTPYYTCAVWAGYDTNEFLEDDCKSFHKNLWKKVMGRIHADLPYVDFEIPSTVKQATICTSSGLLAGSGCPTRTEYFETSTIPSVRCTRHYVAPTPPPLPSPEASPSDSESNTDGDTTTGETTDSATGDGTTTDAGAGATPSDTGGTDAAPPDASAPAAGGDPATPDTGGQDAAPAA